MPAEEAVAASRGAEVLGPAPEPRATRGVQPAKPRREESGARRAREDARRGFPRSRAVLRGEIEARAEDLKTGPVGERGRELASLRLAESGRDLIDAGSLGGAGDALRKAVSLYARNGFAYLFLAHVEHEQGRDAEARELLRKARRDLPDDGGVRSELDELTDAVGGEGRGT